MADELKPDEGSKESQVVKIEVDGKEETFDANRIKGMMDEQASITQKAQSAAAVLNACERLGVDPEQFLARSEGAFQVLNTLLDKKIINDEGEILVSPKEEPPVKQDGEPTPPIKPADQDAESRVLSTIQKALGPIAERLDKQEGEMTKVNRILIQDRLMKMHPELTGDDVTRILGAAKANPERSILQHAEALVKAKSEFNTELREKHAKEFGIDLKEFDANKLKEQGDEGGASALFKGKKFSFKKGENTVSPRDATEEFFNKNL